MTIDDASEALLAALDRARGAERLEAAVRAALDVLARPPHRLDAAEDAIRFAARAALLIDTEIGADVLASLELALGEVLGAVDRPRALLGQPARAAGPAGPWRASVGTVRSWPVEGPFAPQPAPPPPPSEAPATLAAPFTGSPGELAAIFAQAELEDRGPPPPVVPDDAPALAPLGDDERVGDPRAQPVVRVDPEVGLPLPRAEVHARRVARALDSIAMHLRHRRELPARHADAEEHAALAWLDAARVQDDVGAGLWAWWAGAKDQRDPHRIGAPLLVLGSIEGLEGVSAVEPLLASLDPGAVGIVQPAVDALTLSGHPALDALGRDLRRAVHPVARAVGVALGARLGTLAVDEVRLALCDPAGPVAAAAARACAVEAWRELVPLAAPLLGHPSGAVGFEAARALLVAGRLDPLQRLRDDAAFRLRLGASALDLVILAGGPGEDDVVRAIARSVPPSRRLLAGLARFGHPRSWQALVHALGDEALSDAASRGLRGLFGPIVDDDVEGPPRAWRDAIAAGRFAPDVRIAGGMPWDPRVLRAALDAGEESLDELQLRADEIAVRLGLEPVELAGWSSDRRAAGADLLAAIERRAARYPRGTWSLVARGGAA